MAPALASTSGYDIRNDADDVYLFLSRANYTALKLACSPGLRIGPAPAAIMALASLGLEIFLFSGDFGWDSVPLFNSVSGQKLSEGGPRPGRRFTALTGPVPLLPDWAFGAWFTERL